MPDILQQIRTHLFSGDAPKVEELTKEALKNMPFKKVLDDGLIGGMAVVGEKFKNNQIYIPEVLIAARAMQAGMKVLEPILVKEGVRPHGRVVMGTVKGDLHDIGKNLVVMMLKGAGFEVIDLGIDAPPEKFAEAVEKDGAQVVGMSALLTTSMPSMKATIKHLQSKGLDKKAKTMIGGAPVTQEYANEIGADGYGADAPTAVDLAKKFIGV